MLKTAKTKEAIAENQRQASMAEMQRNELMLKSVQNEGLFFDGGDTSYWRKTVDSLKLRIFDNENKIARLKSQIIQFSGQERVEQSRLKTDFLEQHRAPFAGFVNAVYITKGAQVKSGTTLMQILDCSNPVVVIPIPELRLNDFSIGQKVTINPLGTEQLFSGTIKYISSRALIDHDKTIALPQNMTTRGSRAVVTFDKDQPAKKTAKTCVTAQRAIVTIHMHSFYDTIMQWTKAYLEPLVGRLANLQVSDNYHRVN